MYDREIDGKKLTLAPSGWTYKNTFVLYDRETETLWYPEKKGLRGIQGTYVNRYLEIIRSEDTTLKKWMKKHPDTKALQ